MKKSLSFIWEIAQIVIIALIIVAPIRYFLFQPFFVKGESMYPNFKDGDYLIVDELTYRFRDPQRGEVVVFKYPEDPSQRFIKRIIGLPGETVEIKNNKVTITKDEKSFNVDEKKYLSSTVVTSGDMRVTVSSGEFFVMGDNRPFSYDSRRFGLVPKNDIIGRVVVRAWPIKSAELLYSPSY